MDQKATELVNAINEGTADIHNIGVDVCSIVPVQKIQVSRLNYLYERIISDIFYEACLEKDQAKNCFLAILERLFDGKLLWASTLDNYIGLNFIRKGIQKAMTLQSQANEIACAPANILGCAIAAIVYRKLEIDTKNFIRDEDLVKFFGKLNGIQWLPVAIQVWDKIKGAPFGIQVDRKAKRPIAKKRMIDGGERWVVRTRVPEMNRYENIFRDYTRQMKSLGKRLASPGRAVVK
ncbi:hypothetical protein IL306_013756 [Fusarium sp. DS 682]|nr:hypothetical protein IL306_013756 [Fusarium sp. DS 682]